MNLVSSASADKVRRSPSWESVGDGAAKRASNFCVDAGDNLNGVLGASSLGLAMAVVKGSGAWTEADGGRRATGEGVRPIWLI
jgi:hypothetical protein